MEPLISIDIKLALKRQGGTLSSLLDEEVDKAIERYKKFLRLAKEYPSDRLSPTKDIDEIWHLHMLSPIKHHSDCQKYFGKTLDHNGGFGKLDEEKDEWMKYCLKTKELWMELYNEDYFMNTNMKNLDELIKYSSCHSNGVSEPLMNKNHRYKK